MNDPVVETHALNALAELRASQGLRATCLLNVEAEVVDFVWSPYIPDRKVTIIEGDPGEGKSFLTLSMATDLSLGKGPLGTSNMPPQRSLIFTAEDGLADTLKPRLNAMGADTAYVFACEQPINFSVAEEFSRAEKLIAGVQPAIVFIDPIVAYLGAKTDAHRANEVRPILAKLAALAEDYKCAIVVVRHLNKSRGGKAIYRGQGSIDFTAAARSVLLVGSDSSDKTNKAIVHTKCNVGPLGPSLGYTLENGRFVWSGHSDLTAADLLGDDLDRDTRSATDEAADFLRQILADGPVPAKEVFKQAVDSGIAERTINRAKRVLGIKPKKTGMKGGWCWELPQDVIEI